MFKPHHLQKFSLILFKSLKTPLLGYFAFTGNMVMFVSAYIFYHLEKDINSAVQTYWDALWWAICTVSTVGYGDIVPLTGPGRMIAALLIIFGVMFFMGFTAVLASIMSSFITKNKL